MYTDIRGNAGKHEIADSRALQNKLEIGAKEGPFAWLINNCLSIDRSNFRNDLPSGFATYQNSATWTRIPYSCSDSATTPLLVGGQIGQIGPMAFPCVNHVTTPPTRSG